MEKASIYNITARLKKYEHLVRHDHIIAEITQSGAISFRDLITGRDLRLDETKRALSVSETFVLFIDFEDFPEGDSQEIGAWHKKSERDYKKWSELIRMLREESDQNENITRVSGEEN